MPRATFYVLGVVLPLGVLASPAAHAQQYSLDPPFWAVTGVRANDVLHLRDMPSAESKSLAGIPANAQGLKNLGCRRNGPSLDQWARMSKAQREVPPDALVPRRLPGQAGLGRRPLPAQGRARR